MKKTITFLTACGVALLAVVLRVVQLSAAIDFETGFFYDSSSFVSIMLYVLLAVLAVGFIGTIILDKKKGVPAFTKKATDLSSQQTLFFGISVLLGALLTAFEVITGMKETDVLTFIGQLAVAITYLVIAFLILSSKQVKKTSGYLMAILAISYMLRAAGVFMSETVVTRLSDELLLLLTYVLAVFFFFCCGRFLSDNETKFTRAGLLFFSGALVVIASTVTIAKMIAFVTAPSAVSAGMESAPLSETGTLAVSVSLLAILCADVPKPVEKKADEPSAESAAEE